MENGEEKPFASREAPAAPSVPSQAKILPPTQQVLPPAPEKLSKAARRARNWAMRNKQPLAPEPKEEPDVTYDSPVLEGLHAPEAKLKNWPTSKKREIFNALMSLPASQIDSNAKRRTHILSSLLGVKMNSLHKRLQEERQHLISAKNPFGIEDFNVNENTYKMWSDDKKRKFYADLCAIPVEQMTSGICHKIVVMAGFLKIKPNKAILQRQAEAIAEKKKAKSQALKQQSTAQPGAQIPVLPVVRETPNEGVPGMLNVLRNALYDGGPPRDANQFPLSPFTPLPFPAYAPGPEVLRYPGVSNPAYAPAPTPVPFISQPGPSGLPWCPPVPFRLHDANYNLPHVEMGPRPLSREDFAEPMNGAAARHYRSPSPAGRRRNTRSPSPPDRRRRNTRSPSPKRQRREHEADRQVHDEYGTRPNTPTAKELAVSENYTLEPPKRKIDPVYRAPVTIQEMQSCSDMVFLCQFRDSTAVTKPFLHPSSEMIVKRIAHYLGPGFDLKETLLSSAPSSIADRRGIQRTRCDVNVWINGIARLVTIGEGVDPDLHYATNFAYASTMAALCYMMVIPFQLLQVVQNEGPEHIDLVLFSCRHRIREMIAVSREPVYGLLDAYNGGLTSIPPPVRDLWGIFINRMRHSGMEFWESNIIPVPSGIPFFSGNTIPNFFFTCARSKEACFNWSGLVPIHGEIVNFDVSDYNNVFSCSRFFEFPAEAGLIPISSPPPCVESFNNYHLRFKENLDVDINKFDPIVHLPFRDLLYRHGVGLRNTPRFSFFLLKYIGMRWKRALILEHSLEIDVINGVERWKHVVKLSFQGVPFLFLGGKCRADSFPTALRQAGAVVAEQLANMMIIPRELCYFLEKEGKKWAAIIVYVCRHRFAAFEALVRNPMFASLHGVNTANLDISNPLYKLAESFFWRMRSVGFLYWVENHRKLLVPSSFGRLPKLPGDAFFKFVEHYNEEANWDHINAAVGVVDNFHPSALKLEDRIWTVWEGGARLDLERSPEREIKPEVIEPGVSNLQDRSDAAASEVQKHQFEKALEDDFAIPLNALSNAECSAVLNLVRSLAATCKNKGLQMTSGRGPDPVGREGWRCDMAWSGKLKWILSSVYYSTSERDLQFGASWEMYKLLVLMGLFPPGLFRFIGNYEARLPCVVASLAPFMKLLETSLPTFMNHPDEENNRHLLLEHMRKLFVVEWQHRAIELPSELVPCIEEQKRLPFIRVDTMSDETEERWRLSSPQFQRMAKIMDDRGRDVTQKTPRLEPGMKLGNLSASKPILPKKTPPKPVEPPIQMNEDEDVDDEDMDFDEELRQLEELCTKAVNAPNKPPGRTSGEDEYL